MSSAGLAGLNHVNNANNSAVEERELEAYAEHIQNVLTSETLESLSRYLPLSGSNLLENLRDGIVLAHLLDNLQPGCVPLARLDRSINLEDLKHQPALKNKKTIFEVTNNLNLVVEGSKRVKQLVIVNLGANDILEMKKDLVLGLVWQIIRAHLLSAVNLVSRPELIRLLAPGESLQTLLQMRSETLLLRWINYHTSRASSDDQKKGIENFSSDLSDSVKYALLLGQIAPLQFRDVTDTLYQRVQAEESATERAELILKAADLLHCRKFVTPEDIVKGNARLNLAFCATLFNAHIGINLPTEEEIRALIHERDQLAHELSQLKRRFENFAQSGSDEITSLQGQVKELQEQLESERANHAQELLTLHHTVEERESDLERDFRTALDHQLAVERKQWEESYKRTFEKEKEYKRNLERQLRQLRNILLVAQSNIAGGSTSSPTDKKDYGAVASETGSFDLDTLAKEIVEMTKTVVNNNQELNGNVDKLVEKIKHNDRLNNVMGTKIREFSELLIQENKRKPSLRRK